MYKIVSLASWVENLGDETCDHA